MIWQYFKDACLWELFYNIGARDMIVLLDNIFPDSMVDYPVYDRCILHKVFSVIVRSKWLVQQDPSRPLLPLCSWMLILGSLPSEIYYFMMFLVWFIFTLTESHFNCFLVNGCGLCFSTLKTLPVDLNKIDAITHIYERNSGIKFCWIVKFYLDVSMVEQRKVLWSEKCKFIWVKLLASGRFLKSHFC